MQPAYRDHAGNREPMVELESNDSARGNLPAMKQPWGHPLLSPRLRHDPSVRPSLHDFPLLFRCPLYRLTLARAASLDPGGPDQS